MRSSVVKLVLTWDNCSRLTRKKIMPKIKIDEIEYNTEDLSDVGQRLLVSLQFTEAQIQRLDNEIKVYRVAQQSYAQSLKDELETTQDVGGN